MTKKNVLIIGGGAAGLMAAVQAARAGAAVTVLEAMKKPASKLSITGNGRCNMTNIRGDLRSSYHPARNEGDAGDPIDRILEDFSVRDTLAFFDGEGVASRSSGEYVYPRSGSAAHVAEALIRAALSAGVRMRYSTEITSIRRDELSGKWYAATPSWTYEADSVVLACGSKAGTGSGGSGCDLAKEAGHSVVDIIPILVPVKCSDPLIATARGARTFARAKLVSRGSDNNVLFFEEGEVQWTEEGLSGIVIFNLSRHLTRDENGRFPILQLDLVPDISTDELEESIARLREHLGENVPLSVLLSSYTNPRVAAYLEERAAAGDHLFSDDSAPEPSVAARLLKNVAFEITGTGGFDSAQCCRGGVPLSEIDPGSMESLIAPGLFFAGEMIDVDGPCGGFNLQWAWSTGYIAGRHAAQMPF